jgi:ATP-dependent Clp protease, protease subunit
MKTAQARGEDLADYIDPAGMEALRKITALAGDEKEITGPTMANVIPTVIETDKNGGSRPADIFSHLMRNRILLLEGVVDDTMASIACASLMYLDSALSARNPQEAEALRKDGKGVEIEIHINSPGGSVLSGLAIYDTMRTIKSPITTRGFGMQASMGSILLAAGDKRTMSRNSWLMIHQISSSMQGQHSDLAIAESLTARLHEQLKDIYVRHIGLTHEFWDVALERDTWLTPEQALKMGFIHEIIVPNNAKTTAFDKESLRSEFGKAAEAQVPTTADKILLMLNNVSAAGGMAGKIRPELVTALSQFPRFWTEAKKKAKNQPANDNTTATDATNTATPPKKTNGPNGPA